MYGWTTQIEIDAEERAKNLRRYSEIQAELNALYERARRAIHPAVISNYEARISYKESELATILS